MKRALGALCLAALLPFTADAAEMPFAPLYHGYVIGTGAEAAPSGARLFTSGEELSDFLAAENMQALVPDWRPDFSRDAVVCLELRSSQGLRARRPHEVTAVDVSPSGVAVTYRSALEGPGYQVTGPEAVQMREVFLLAVPREAAIDARAAAQEETISPASAAEGASGPAGQR